METLTRQIQPESVGAVGRHVDGRDAPGAASAAGASAARPRT